MKLPLFLIPFLLITAIGCTQKSDPQKDYGFELVTPDSVTIYGDTYISDPGAATVVLFHQGGSNSRAEYGPIIPTLRDQGYNVVTVDQRRGGQTYGSYNRTVEKLEINPYSYCDAYPDLESTLDYVISSNMISGDIIVWGSSYSGTLVIQLAAKNQDRLSGVLAFSPASGGPMADCKPDEYFEDLEIPLLLLRPGSEMEFESVQAQFALAEEAGHEGYVSENGVHGASMLVESRVEGSVEAHWTKVLEFISDSIGQ